MKLVHCILATTIAWGHGVIACQPIEATDETDIGAKDEDEDEDEQESDEDNKRDTDAGADEADASRGPETETDADNASDSHDTSTDSSPDSDETDTVPALPDAGGDGTEASSPSSDSGSVVETEAWEDGFESGFGDWSVEGGLWSIGEPDFDEGPDPLNGERLAGTNLGGDYEEAQDARLVSPQFSIEADMANPRFKFAYWHALNSGDYGQVEISVDGGDWEPAFPEKMIGSTGGWGQQVVLLRQYAGSRVRVGVRLVSTNSSGGSVDVAAGIYVDDAAFETGEMSLDADDFEGGLGDWSVEGGNWAKGEPAADVGPAPLSGEQVMGTNLGGNYLDDNGSIETRSRLVSPEFLIEDAADNPRFKLAYWHALNSGDYGQFQVSVDGDAWEDLVDDPIIGSSGGWGQRVLPLRGYAGSRVRIGLLIATSNSRGGSVDVAAGIYVDDAAFETGEMSLDADDFEDGLGDWSVEGGNWAKGEPSADVGPAPLSGDQVWGTNLRGNYLDDNGSIETRARLVSPELFIDDAFATPRLRVGFWHELAAGDTGRFQVSVDGEAWEDLPGDQMTGDSGGWGQRVVELDEYEGRRVRVGLLLSTTNQSGGSVDVASGLYVDDASFVTE